MRRALQLLMATMIAVLGWLVASTPSTVAVPDGPQAAYTYDAPLYGAPVEHASSERGPPARAYSYTTVDAADPLSSGASACSSAPRSRLATNHNDPTGLMQVARATGTTSGHAEAICGDLSSLRLVQVAAETENSGISKAAFPSAR